MGWSGVMPAHSQSQLESKPGLPPLTVSGNRIRTSTGQDVILRGVWLSDGLRDSYDWETIRHLRQSWNVNVIHFPICPIPYESDPEYLKKHVDPIRRGHWKQWCLPHPVLACFTETR